MTTPPEPGDLGGASARRGLQHPVVGLVLDLAAAPRFAQALSVAVLLAAFGVHAVHELLGRAGEIGVLGGLLALTALSLIGARDRIEWNGVLPVSLLILFGWILVSVFWSQYTWTTLGGIAAALVWGWLGLFLALGRDLIQLVRAAGDALRILLGVSLGLEVLSGIVFDVPFAFLSIQGNIATGGPIQGVADSRNFLGFTALIAIVTFVLEWRTRSIRRGLAIASLVAAGLCLLLTRSPVTLVAALIGGLATLALIALRRLGEDARRWTQLGLFLAVVVTGGLLWAFRSRVIDLLDLAADVRFRTGLWQTLLAWPYGNSIIGSGWVGVWNTDVFPFSAFNLLVGRRQQTGLSAYVDMWFQTGAAGLLILAVALGLAFWRAWGIASDSRIVVAVWPAVVLVIIAVTSLAESYLLTGAGLMLFVAIGTQSAHRRSWRRRLPVTGG